LGDGRSALFWESTWSDGVDPRDLAPKLYKLAWRKGLTVREEVENQTWTRGLWRMSNAEEMAEFILLWERVQEVVFSDQPDITSWKWTVNGQYSSKSAYAIQFAGSYCTFNSTAIWKAKTEGKHRFFGWLFLQQKIQTADNLTLKGIPCDPQCCLCDQAPESAAHLCLQCPFAQEVWFLVHVWTEGLIAVPSSDAHVEDWWNEALSRASTHNKSHFAAVLLYTIWNIWN